MKTLICFAIALPAFGTQLQVDRIEWEGLDGQHLRLAIYLKTETRTPVTLRRLRFQEMAASGIPFQVHPPGETISLPLTDPLRIPVTIELRHLADLAAVRRMVETEKLTIRGKASFELELPWYYRIFLFTSSIPLQIPIAHDVPITIPGGPFARAAALAAIYALEASLEGRKPEMKTAFPSQLVRNLAQIS